MATDIDDNALQLSQFTWNSETYIHTSIAWCHIMLHRITFHHITHHVTH